MIRFRDEGVRIRVWDVPHSKPPSAQSTPPFRIAGAPSAPAPSSERKSPACKNYCAELLHIWVRMVTADNCVVISFSQTRPPLLNCHSAQRASTFIREHVVLVCITLLLKCSKDNGTLGQIKIVKHLCIKFHRQLLKEKKHALTCEKCNTNYYTFVSYYQ